MKKALKIIGITIVVIFLLLLILPFAFKGKIVQLVKDEANKNLKAQVDFADVNLSLIRNFPNLSVNIDKLSVVGVEPFESDTLAYIDDLFLTLDIMSVIRGSEIQIKKIKLDKPVINILVLKDGTANYDITIDDDEDASANEESDSDVKLDIKEYQITNGSFIYNDATFPMLLSLQGLNHTGKGNFAEEVFTLSTQTKIDQTIVDYDGIRYLKNARATLDADIAMDLKNWKFEFMENEFNVNQLVLGFEGWLAMPDDDIDMDFTFATKKSDLKTIMSIIPAEFTQDLEGVKADGVLALSGFVKGVYNENNMPGFGMDLKIENGNVQYPDLPRSIENIQIAMHVLSPEGKDLNNLTLDIPQFHMEIGKSAQNPNTIDARLSLKNPETDPLIDTKVSADLNLGSFKDVIPLDNNFNLAGMFHADFEVKGALSAIENQQFNNFKAAGSAALTGFAYADEDVNAQIPEARVSLNPQNLHLQTLKVIYEEMNIAMDGHLNNYIAYALSDTTLQGVFNLSIDKIDANKFISEDETEDENEETATPSEPVLVPDNLDVTLNAKIGELKYDDLLVSNISGALAIKDQTVALRDMVFQLLQGSGKMAGSYNTQNQNVPKANFSFNLSQIDIAETANAFTTVEKYAPIAKQASGKISTDFEIQTDLLPDFTPVYETMNGHGSFHSKHVVLEGGKFLQKLSETLKSPKLAKQNIQDIHASFIIEDGKIITSPFDVKIDKIKAEVSGYSSFDATMDYLMAMDVPREELGSDFNKMAEGLLSSANAFLGGNIKLGDMIKVDVRIHGDISDPKITPSFGGLGGETTLKDQAKEAVKEAVDEKIDEAKEKAREEAIKRADKIIADAQKQADAVKAEAKKAADKVRSEANANAQKLIDEAKNPIAKKAAEVAADKLRKEGEATASKIESEANKQADDIMAKARAEADKLKNE